MYRISFISDEGTPITLYAERPHFLPPRPGQPIHLPRLGGRSKVANFTTVERLTVEYLAPADAPKEGTHAR